MRGDGEHSLITRSTQVCTRVVETAIQLCRKKGKVVWDHFVVKVTGVIDYNDSLLSCLC